MSTQAVLFDLDGTLADTARDMIVALNRLLDETGQPQLTRTEFCPHLSQGARGIVRFAFGEALDAATEERLFSRFLKLYSENLCVNTCLFPDVASTLHKLTRSGIVWGVVTNKRRAYAEPLLKHLGITPHAACQVYGDTTSSKKPNPDPLIYATRQICRAPAACAYVGDSTHDMHAATTAGIRPIFAAYGYGNQAFSPSDFPHCQMLHRFDALPQLL